MTGDRNRFESCISGSAAMRDQTMASCCALRMCWSMPGGRHAAAGGLPADGEIVHPHLGPGPDEHAELVSRQRRAVRAEARLQPISLQILLDVGNVEGTHDASMAAYVGIVGAPDANCPDPDA